MNPSAVNPYLRTKVMTAGPEELRLMLYDGAIKFGRQARAALEAHRIEDSHHHLIRVQQIVMELSASLRHNVAKDLCEKLAALYNYIYRKLVEANMSHDPAPLEEALQLLEFERETWRMLMTNLAAGQGEAQSAAPSMAVST